MTIGVLSRRTGVPVKLLREYEDAGLIYTVGRSAGNYRIFDDEALWCVTVITGLRAVGLTRAEIHDLTGDYLHRPDEPIGPRLAQLLAGVRAPPPASRNCSNGWNTWTSSKPITPASSPAGQTSAPAIPVHPAPPTGSRGTRRAVAGLDSPPAQAGVAMSGPCGDGLRRDCRTIPPPNAWSIKSCPPLACLPWPASLPSLWCSTSRHTWRPVPASCSPGSRRPPAAAGVPPLLALSARPLPRDWRRLAHAQQHRLRRSGARSQPHPR